MGNTSKKVLMVDPNDTVEYVYGLLKGLSMNAEVVYVTKKTSTINLGGIKVKKWFYREECNSKIAMGINYLFSYVKIIMLILFKQIDVVHIQWFKLEKIDVFLIKIMKKMCNVVYTAHNVLPHINGEEKFQEYNAIYAAVNKIIVHGQFIKNELVDRFQIDESKIYIQPYGFSLLDESIKVEESELIEKVRNLKNVYDKVIVSVGLICQYKGTDRLLKIWNEKFKDTDNLLVIAGRVIEQNEELLEQIEHKGNNVLFWDSKLTDYEFSKLCELADLIVLPYRNASMSGVVYSAARAKTPILTTRVGAIPDYLVDSQDSFIVDNVDEELQLGIEKVLSMDRNVLKSMGHQLYNNFGEKYEWLAITKELNQKCY